MSPMPMTPQMMSEQGGMSMSAPLTNADMDHHMAPVNPQGMVVSPDGTVLMAPGLQGVPQDAALFARFNEQMMYRNHF